MTLDVRPFTVAVPDPVLADLRQRLARTRWPDEVAGAGWAYGANVAFMRQLVAYWRDGFDWRAQEAHINAFANYRAEVDGLGLHVVHERGRGPHPLPLLLVHGWPSSFFEMLELIPLLTDPGSHGGDPADAFDVVTPSIPGFGFSDPPRPGTTTRELSELWARLMDGLGYPRFGAHAYDIGASFTSPLALYRPERLIGYHTTEPGIPAPDLGPDAPGLSEAERAYLALRERWQAEDGGYMAIQRTRPQTLAYGLNDSPVGLAAWIVEKWHAWTAPPDGDLLARFTMDQLLTNVTIYWVTETINSANRWYYAGPAVDELPVARPRLGLDLRANVPVGVALTATQPIERAPREYAARVYPDIRRWAELPRGGHFVTLEEPRLLADAIRAFFRELRGGGSSAG